MIDLIDRQAVIDLLKQMRKDGDMVPWEGKDVFARIRKLPTIQPEKAQLSSEGTTSDLISRQAAIDALDFEIVHMTAYCDGKNEGNPLAQYNKGLEDGKKAIEALPPAQPEPKEGHWENDKHDMPRCSQCGYIPEYNRFVDDYYYSDYCPNCGAHMKGATP